MVRKLKIRTEPVLREVVDVVPSDNSGLSGWAVALIIIFVVLVVLTIVIVAYSCTRKKRCFGKGDVLVSGSANSQSAPSFSNPLSNADGHCNRAGEKRALDNAFNGSMQMPPCNGQKYPGSMPTEPLLASSMNKLGSKHVDKAFNKALHSGASCNNNSQLLNNLNHTYNTAQVQAYPGITQGEVEAQKMSAALNANDLDAPDSPNLVTAGESPPQGPGLMAYNVSSKGQTNGKGAQQGELTNNAWALDPAEDLTLALNDEDAQLASNVWNVATSMPSQAHNSGAAAAQVNKNNKSLILAAEANPQEAANILLNASAIVQPNIASMQAANRSVTRPLEAKPPIGQLNIPLNALLRVPRATAAVGIQNVPFNMPTMYFEAARASQCSQ